MSLCFHNFIDHISGRGIRPGLDRLKSALFQLGIDSKRDGIVLVGGTNGKGTTAKMLESALRSTGASTYLYTSPHLVGFEERFRFNGQSILREDLDKAHSDCLAVFPDGRSEHGDLTPFEWMTLVGAYAAQTKDVDFWILEVGLGGRLDAVNCFEPSLSIITSIGLDHCLQLGNTLESIAKEKMGIARNGVPLLVGTGAQPWVKAVNSLIEGRDFTFGNGKYRGLHQGLTTQSRPISDSSYSLALAGTELLVPQASLEKASKAALGATWPARCDLIQENPVSIMDGAHNPAACMWLSETLTRRYPGQKFHVLLGVRQDKDVEGIVQALSRIAIRFTAVEDKGGFLMRAPDLSHRIRAVSGIETASMDRSMVEILKDESSPILVTGSLYLCGELIESLGFTSALRQLN